MSARLLAFLLLTAGALSAAKNAVATARGENQDIALSVTLYIDAEGVNKAVGAELGDRYIVADVKVEPKSGKAVILHRDDFLLHSYKNGEKTRPFAPSEIAGRGGMILRRQEGGGGFAVGTGRRYPLGYPPVYTGSGPPPSAPSEVGVGGAGDGSTEVSRKSPAADKENPLERRLEEKELPQTKTTGPVSGLLYFGMEKQKMKDLELTYGGRKDGITLRFQ